MALWSNVDEEAGKPKNLTATEKANTLGVDAEEAGQTAGVAHAGWVLKKEGTGGRAGRVSYETLVAMGSMTGDTDSLPPLPVITIDTQPTPETITDGDPVTFVASASVTGVSTLSYQWQVSTDSGSTWANTVDADGTNPTLTVISTDAEYATENQFRVVVSGTNGAVDVTSNAVTLTVESAVPVFTSQVTVTPSATNASFTSNTISLTFPDYPTPNLITGIDSYNALRLSVGGDQWIGVYSYTGMTATETSIASYNLTATYTLIEGFDVLTSGVTGPTSIEFGTYA